MGPLMRMAAASGLTILQPRRWPAGARRIVLTFDDGPNARDGVSARLLDVLKRHDVPATFCMIGANMEASPELVARTVAEGHEIAHHSFTHGAGALLWPPALEAEVARLEARYRDIVGDERAAARPIRRFRPPLGLRTPAVRAVVRRRGLREAYLTFFVNDAYTEPDGAAPLLERIQRGIAKHHGAAIVLHEMRYTRGLRRELEKAWLPGAVERLIAWARSNDFDFARYDDEGGNASLG